MGRFVSSEQQTQPKRVIGYVSRAGKYVPSSVLGGYSLKQSKQLDESTDTGFPTSTIEPLYDPESLAQLLEFNTYHYRACRVKARDTAGLGWFLDSLVENPSEEQQARVETFFSDLNPPIAITLDRAQLDFESTGYAALEMVRRDYAHDGEPEALVHVPSYTLRIARAEGFAKAGERIVQRRGAQQRWFRLVGTDFEIDQNTGKTYAPGTLDASVRGTEIILWQNYVPRSPHYGIPDILPGLGALLGDLSRRDYNIAFFDNYGVPAYAVFITGDYDPGPVDEHGVTELERAIETHFKDLAAHPHSVLVMALPTRASHTGGEVKVEFQPLAVEVEEASFRLYRQDNRDEILAAHGVPPYRAGIAETGSLGGSTAEETTEIYKRSVIEPRQSLIEDLINRYIVRGAFEATDYRFKLSEIDTADEAHEMALLTALFDRRAITARELREQFSERFGLDPDAVLPDEMGPNLQEIESAVEGLQEKALKFLNVHPEPFELVRNGGAR